ncbi:predicted protein [Uncinocarpus reesii 1704]|uniref:Uncharacterized protein n=1 Tax=Uncinocarpus reesii (strain UAMH 1704) TaxID=336963 RepID=C4JSW1_UNCRE|nr:uncharacterized protein UREG_05550 [Uncinocarpus reesii 1704]EEP80708.1 predicted protein [Uncinocarpus reesii 1704]
MWESSHRPTSISIEAPQTPAPSLQAVLQLSVNLARCHGNQSPPQGPANINPLDHLWEDLVALPSGQGSRLNPLHRGSPAGHATRPPVKNRKAAALESGERLNAASDRQNDQGNEPSAQPFGGWPNYVTMSCTNNPEATAAMRSHAASWVPAQVQERLGENFRWRDGEKPVTAQRERSSKSLRIRKKWTPSITN